MNVTERLPRSPLRSLGLMSLCLMGLSMLSACSSPQPIVQTRTVTVQVPAYVRLDDVLTAPVPIPHPADRMTNRDLLELAISRGQALQQANRQLSAIRELQTK